MHLKHLQYSAAHGNYNRLCYTEYVHTKAVKLQFSTLQACQLTATCTASVYIITYDWNPVKASRWSPDPILTLCCANSATVVRDTHRSGYLVSPANPPALDSSCGTELKQSRDSRFSLDKGRTVDSPVRRQLVVFTCQSSGFSSRQTEPGEQLQQNQRAQCHRAPEKMISQRGR